MKKLLLAIILCAGFAASVFGQSNPPLRLQEIDGSPNVLGVTTIKVTNGTLSCSGKICTITISGGGGGSPGGSTTQLQYNNAGSFGGITGATTDGTAVTLTSPILVTPAIGIATGTSLTITGAFRTSTANQRIYFGSGSNSFRWSDTVGPYFIDNTATGGLVFNMQSLSSDRTFTWPNASGTVTTIAGTQTLTNKTVTDSTNVLGGVTMTLGSDATGDIYYRNSGGVLTRLGVGSNGQVLTLASGLPSWAAASGGGITVGTTTITSGITGAVPYNNAGVYAESNLNFASSALTFTRTALGVTSTDGLTLTNTTAAAAGAQQYSPRLRLTGQGWKTNATAASQTVDWIVENQPVQGSANPTANFVVSNQVNAGGYSAIATLSSAGVLTLNATTGLLVIDPTSGGTGEIVRFGGAGGRGVWAANSGLAFKNSSNQFTLSSANAGIDWSVSRDATFGWSNTASNATATQDLIIRRSTAANLAFGAADAAAPVAQTMSVQNVVAGTSNTAGVNWTHDASIGTGTGVGGDYIVRTAPAGSTGTAQNSLAAAFTVKGNGAVQLKSVTFTNLPTVANGYLIYCNDCTLASPCASGGTGALAKGINGAWVCN